VRRLLIVMVLAASLAACGGKTNTAEDSLLDALAATELLSREVQYAVTSDEGDDVGVDITIEDDYRYASELRIDGEVAYREVVYDDALAAQVVDDEVTGLLGAAPDATVPTGGWVVDEIGAPPAVLPAKQAGADPIVDALAFLSYVRQAAQGSDVIKFDEDALDYRPDEDPFPHPQAHEIRYDILPTRLPDRAAIERAGGADVPDLSDLRKLAVYVRDGEVVAVREVIDVAPFIDTLRRSFDAGGEDADELLERINELRASIGQEPVVPRATTMLIRSRGTSLRVALPEGTPATLQLHVGDLVTAPTVDE